MRKNPDQFIPYFTQEFMDELWYLQKLGRGDIKERDEPNAWGALIQIAIGILGQVNPAAALGIVITKEIAEKLVKIGEKAYEAYQVGSKAYATLQGESGADIKNIQNLTIFSGNEKSPIDLDAMRILAELLGRGLAQRYEEVLDERLDGKDIESSFVPLARVGAKRCFRFLQSEEYKKRAASSSSTTSSQSLLSHRAVLMEGIIIEDALNSGRIKRVKHFIETRLPQVMKNLMKQHLALNPKGKGLFNQRTGSSTVQKFTADDIYGRSAWRVKEDKDCYDVTEGERTIWLNPVDREGKIISSEMRAPLYGYAWVADTKYLPAILKLKPYEADNEPPLSDRYYREVTRDQVVAYLQSDEVKEARRTKTTATINFHRFLQTSPDYRYSDPCQAICHEELDQDWSYADFTGMDFSGATLKGKMDGAIFDQAYLVGTRFENITNKEKALSFKGAKLGFAWLQNISLENADLTQADLSFADLTKVVFNEKTIIFGTIWHKTCLVNVKHESLIMQLKTEFKELQKKIEERYTKLEEQMKHLEETVMPLSKKIAEFEQKLAEVESINKKAIEELLVEHEAMIVNQINRATPLIEQYAAELLRIDQTQGKHGEEIKSLQAITQYLKEEKTKNEARIDKLEERFNQLFKEVHELKESHHKLERVVSTLGHTMESLQENLRRDMNQQLTEIDVKSSTSIKRSPIEEKIIHSVKHKMPNEALRECEEVMKTAEGRESAEIMAILGALLLNSPSVTPEEQKRAIDLFIESDKRSCSRGTYNLAFANYSGGGGLPINQLKAVDLFLKVADQAKGSVKKSVDKTLASLPYRTPDPLEDGSRAYDKWIQAFKKGKINLHNQQKEEQERELDKALLQHYARMKDKVKSYEAGYNLLLRKIQGVTTYDTADATKSTYKTPPATSAGEESKRNEIQQEPKIGDNQLATTLTPTAGTLTGSSQTPAKSDVSAVMITPSLGQTNWKKPGDDSASQSSSTSSSTLSSVSGLSTS